MMFSFLQSLLFKSSELGLGVTILKLIHEAFKKSPDLTLKEGFWRKELQRFVYRLIPVRYKSPIGPVTEAEFNDAIDEGIEFYIALSALFTK